MKLNDAETAALYLVEVMPPAMRRELERLLLIADLRCAAPLRLLPQASRFFSFFPAINHAPHSPPADARARSRLQLYADRWRKRFFCSELPAAAIIGRYPAGGSPPRADCTRDPIALPFLPIGAR
jgi:hypothetical protein